MDLKLVREILREIFLRLRVRANECDVLLSLPQNSPTPLVADLMRVLLNEMDVMGVAIARQPTLVLYAYDVTTGVVVDVGDRMNIVPIVDGETLAVGFVRT